jgi:hypothetical protein
MPPSYAGEGRPETYQGQAGNTVITPYSSRLEQPRMAKVKIYKRDGSTTPYFWSDKDLTHATHKTVFKQTNGGVKRMVGVHFDTATKRIQKH